MENVTKKCNLTLKVGDQECKRSNHVVAKNIETSSGRCIGQHIEDCYTAPDGQRVSIEYDELRDSFINDCSNNNKDAAVKAAGILEKERVIYQCLTSKNPELHFTGIQLANMQDTWNKIFTNFIEYLQKEDSVKFSKTDGRDLISIVKNYDPTQLLYETKEDDDYKLAESRCFSGLLEAFFKFFIYRYSNELANIFEGYPTEAFLNCA